MLLLDFGKHNGRDINGIDDEYLQWMIGSFSQSSQWHKAATDVLTTRQKREPRWNHGLLANLKSASTRRDRHWGRRLHAKAAETGSDSNLYVATALVKMYANCGSMVDARSVFDSIHEPDVVSWNALLFGYVENGEGHVSLELFSKMKADGLVPNSVTYVAALKACTDLAAKQDAAGALAIGRAIHLEIGDQLDLYVQNTLIDMYAKCGSMDDARHVFNSIQKPDVVSWSVLLLASAENGEGHVSLELFSKMKADGCVPNSVTYVAALKACTALAVNGDGSDNAQGLEIGRKIHGEIGDHLNPYVQNTLIDMYAKCGCMLDARRVFDNIEKPDVVSWNALLLGYAEHGEGHISLKLFSKMKTQGCAPSSLTYVAALKACTSLAVNGDSSGLELGSEIHLEMGHNGLNSHLHSTLIDMYAKCGSMVNARWVFDSILKPDVVCWTALLLGYAENGEGHVSVELFDKMKAQGCVPDSITFSAVLKACGSVGALALGRKLHESISEFTVRVVTCLVDFYAKCGSMDEARAVFDRHSRARDITTWNALLAGYSSCGDACSVFNLFEALQDTGLRPDGVTVLSLLLCCNHAGLVDKAKQYLEAMPLQYGIPPDAFHYSCMVDILGRANRLLEAVSLLRRSPHNPNVVTWTALLGSCCKWKNVKVGRMAFQSVIELDKEDASAYVVMAQIYGTCGMWEEQAEVLECRPAQGEKRYTEEEASTGALRITQTDREQLRYRRTQSST